MNDAICLVRAKDSVICCVYPGFEPLFGYASEDLAGKPMSLINTGDGFKPFSEISLEVYSQLSRTGKFLRTFQCRKKDGTLFQCQAHFSELIHRTFGPVWVVVYKDLTPKNQFLEDARNAERQKIRESERTRISREIHDGLGQSLTLLKMDLFNLKTELSPEQSVTYKKLTEIGDSVNTLIKTARTIAHQVRPEVLEIHGLETAVEQLVSELRIRTKKQINLNICLGKPVSCQEVELALFRILQESLTNTFRHSPSERVDISLRRMPDEISLIVRDYGDVKASYQIKKDNLGVISMKERATSLGGSFHINYDGGTVVSVNVPVEARLSQ